MFAPLVYEGRGEVADPAAHVIILSQRNAKKRGPTIRAFEPCLDLI
jgi:hypothetical protein